MFSPLLSLNVLQLRTLISDFSIIIAILVFCGVDCMLELDTPKLHVPTEIKVHSSLTISILIISFLNHCWDARLLMIKFLHIYQSFLTFVWICQCNDSFTENIFSFLLSLFLRVNTIFMCLPSSLSYYTSLFVHPLSWCVCVCGHVAEEANQWFCHLHVNHVLCGSGYVDGVRHTQINRSNWVQGI